MKRSDENEAENASDLPAPRNRARKASHEGESSQTDEMRTGRKDEMRTGRNAEPPRAKTVRRRFLQLLGVGSALFVAGCSSVTGKASKEQVNYQYHPKGDQQCSNCQYYVPPEDGGGAGTCSRVEGDIEPDDWCSVYSKG